MSNSYSEIPHKLFLVNTMEALVTRAFEENLVKVKQIKIELQPLFLMRISAELQESIIENYDRFISMISSNDQEQLFTRYEYENIVKEITSNILFKYIDKVESDAKAALDKSHYTFDPDWFKHNI